MSAMTCADVERILGSGGDTDFAALRASRTNGKNRLAVPPVPDGIGEGADGDHDPKVVRFAALLAKLTGTTA